MAKEHRMDIRVSDEEYIWLTNTAKKQELSRHQVLRRAFKLYRAQYDIEEAEKERQQYDK